MVWVAASHSAALASLVLVAEVAPRIVLTLIGGAISDRFGAGRVMLASDATMASLMATFAAVAFIQGPSPWLLLTAALLMGTADAFYLPSSGAMPKFLVPTLALPRAMAARQFVAQGAGVVGPVLGGVVVAWVGLGASFTWAFAGYLGMALILVAIWRSLPRSSISDHSKSFVADLRSGISFVFRTPKIRTLVLLTGAFAAFVIPVTALIVPLLARDQGLPPAVAGTLVTAFGVGMAAMTALVIVRGRSDRPGLIAPLGMFLCGVGTIILAASVALPTLLLAAFTAGVGTGLFSTHVGPLFVALVPADHMGRAQSVMILAQSAPLLIASPTIGGITDTVGAPTAGMVWGLGALVTGGLALAHTGFRQATLE